MTGWFVVRRGWMDGFKPEPFTEREAFLWSLEQAAWEGHEQWFNGQPITVARGEFATSLRTMALTFDWSVKRVRGLMERLGKAGIWAQRAAHSGAQAPTILTVCNYDAIQVSTDERGTDPGTAKGTPGAQQGHSKGTVRAHNRTKTTIGTRVKKGKKTSLLGPLAATMLSLRSLPIRRFVRRSCPKAGRSSPARTASKN